MCGSPGLAGADGPTVLPPVEVTGTRIGGWNVICHGMACAYLLDTGPQYSPDLDILPLAGDDEGAPETATEDDHEDNPNAANCEAAAEYRLWHAAHVFHNWRERTLGAMVTAGGGQLIVVTFTDGGREIYQWIPGSIPAHTRPPELYLTAIPGSHHCN